jgi:GNAT superfamily N-acetyltransferase
MNLNLISVSSVSDPNWLFLISCLEEAFPVNERSSSASLASLLNLTEMKCHLIVLDNDPIGIFNTWNLSLFRYIEYLAIVPSMRGKGFGKRVLHDFVHQTISPVILEVEPPVSYTAQRRIRFYEHEGFVLCPDAYCQPAYDADRSPLLLQLMEYGNQLLPDHFDQVVDLLYQKVYQIHIHKHT